MQNQRSGLHAQAPELATHSKRTGITEKKQHQRNSLNHQAQQTSVVHPDHSETYFQLQEGKTTSIFMSQFKVMTSHDFFTREYSTFMIRKKQNETKTQSADTVGQCFCITSVQQYQAFLYNSEQVPCYFQRRIINTMNILLKQ